jgi:undecaprenyl-diphosphatase
MSEFVNTVPSNIQFSEPNPPRVAPPHHPDRPGAIPIVFWIALALALALSVASAYVAYFPIDLRLTRFVQQIGVSGFRSLMIAVSWPGDQSHWLLITVIAAAFLYRRHKSAAIFLFGGAIGGWLLNNLLKVIIARPRPSASLVAVYAQRSTLSFPSGHVMSYVTVYGFLFFLVYMLAPRSGGRIAALILLGALVGLVGLSRVYLGAHWASDVVGGYLYGAVWLTLIIHFYRRRVYFIEPQNIETG